MLQGRYRDAVTAARQAIDDAEATGNRSALSGALNGMGIPLAAQGAVDEGTAALRRAIEIARDQGRPRELESAQVNLADSLHLAGRDREALGVARTARDEARGAGTTASGSTSTIAELLIELGDWDEAERLLPDQSRRFVGNESIFVEIKRAEMALGRGRHDAAAAHLARLAEPVAASGESQWHGGYGALLAELRRRQGDLDGARAAVDEALDRIEFCTEDASRLARVSAEAVSVEADRAQRGRDLGDDAEVTRALGDIEAYVMRVEAAAEVSGLPVEAAWLANARGRRRARRRRAVGRAVARGRGRVGRDRAPVPRRARALARGRGAMSRADDRETAAPLAAEGLALARRLGARWLEGEVEGLVARARLRLDPDADGDASRRRTGPAARPTRTRSA